MWKKSGSGSCGGLCAIRVLLEDNAFNPPSIIQSDRGSAFEEEVALLVLAGLFVDVHVCARACAHMRDCVCVLQSLSNDNTPTSKYTHLDQSGILSFSLVQFLRVCLLSRG